MKSTESLDDTGISGDLSSAVGEKAIPSDTSIPENKRRRLVRGAVAFAPLVLTLRSGALAAASCTGARLVQVNRNNRIAKDEAIASDVCFPSVQICEGSSEALGPTKITSVPAPTGIALTQNNNFTWNCPGSTAGQRVAILSSSSANSLGYRP